MTLWEYDVFHSQPKGILHNVSLEIPNNTIIIDIKVVDAQLNYNILLGHSYMYAMKEIASTIFHLMMFSYEGKIVMIEQLMYYDTKASSITKSVLLAIEGCLSMPLFMEVGLGLYIDPFMIFFFLDFLLKFLLRTHPYCEP